MGRKNTTYRTDSSLEEYEQDKQRKMWFDYHFVQQLMPSPRGGFEDVDPDEIAQPPAYVVCCQDCGALVLTGEWYGDQYLNQHRTWHDNNDRGGSDG